MNRPPPDEVSNHPSRNASAPSAASPSQDPPSSQATALLSQDAQEDARPWLDDDLKKVAACATHDQFYRAVFARLGVFFGGKMLWLPGYCWQGLWPVLC